MKISSVFCISAIAASTLITFSTAAIAISQPKNITENLSQTSQISTYSSEKSDPAEPSRICPTWLQPLCGWW